jgi:alkylhydroperoxidase family enzyme
MAFIPMIPEEEATGLLKECYDKNLQTVGRTSEVVTALSLRPEALRVSTHFRSTTLFGASDLGRRREEFIATLISDLVQCSY